MGGSGGGGGGRGRNRRPNLVIFVVWNTLIVGAWALVGWGCWKHGVENLV